MGVIAVCFQADERNEDYEEKHKKLHEETDCGGMYLYDDVAAAG